MSLEKFCGNEVPDRRAGKGWREDPKVILPGDFRGQAPNITALYTSRAFQGTIVGLYSLCYDCDVWMREN